MLPQTPSQTVGPYFAYGLTPAEYGRPAIVDNVLVNGGTAGERIRIHGRVTDGADQPITDALLEIWQADSAGCYPHPEDGRRADPEFRGFGRCATDVNGMFSFLTIKPGRVPDPGGGFQAPHVSLIVLLRGILSHAYTRIYFSDETGPNQEDALLSKVEPGRRPTLIAQLDDSRKVLRYRFDVHMQGPEETVFFDV